MKKIIQLINFAVEKTIILLFAIGFYFLVKLDLAMFGAISVCACLLGMIYCSLCERAIK